MELDRTQARRIRRQELRLKVAAGGVQVLAHELASMCSQAVPDDQQPLPEVRDKPAITEMCDQLEWN